MGERITLRLSARIALCTDRIVKRLDARITFGGDKGVTEGCVHAALVHRLFLHSLFVWELGCPAKASEVTSERCFWRFVKRLLEGLLRNVQKEECSSFH